MIHKPVLLKEVIEYLQPNKNENFIDATFGLGGHSFELIKYIKPKGKILALEWDPYLVEIIKHKIMKEKNIILKNKNFKYIKKIAKEESFSNIKGVIFDLGISNWHYKKSQRGFSFKDKKSLDMRINPYETKITAFDVINYFSKDQLVEIFSKYGEEKKSEIIANEIVKKRKEKKIQSAYELSEIIAKLNVNRKSKINPATKIFMALRMFINQELENLEIALEDAYDILIKGGRIVIITFNGLEDKVVKKFFKKIKSKKAVIITKKVIRPKLKELKSNPSSRSAKLRVVQKDE
ncbi:MAG: ribosomal RNA small subunit methyltransferase H [Candidatus Parcubacteria bacterium]|nr:MAG: ribosomal RNA small subunit methyltransferase H [Candidatus Parcubacteria bacterium]